MWGVAGKGHPDQLHEQLNTQASRCCPSRILKTDNAPDHGEAHEQPEDEEAPGVVKADRPVHDQGPAEVKVTRVGWGWWTVGVDAAVEQHETRRAGE